MTINKKWEFDLKSYCIGVIIMTIWQPIFNHFFLTKLDYFLHRVFQ